MAKLRSFIALPIPDRLKTEIAVMIEEFTREFSNVSAPLPIKWVSRENLHITLVFLGEISSDFLNKTQDILKELTKTVTPFKVQLRGLGAFPNPRSARVVWIGIKEGAEQISYFQNKLEEALMTIGYKPEERKFHPHLTIGRIKVPLTGPNKEKFLKILETNYQSEVFPINNVILFKSTLTPSGPIYEIIKEFPLGV
ncbi:MAG: RNA 2',3'-cyclic phosphodiesterase [candidate division WOR-3 bacterium]